jgi:hypothetical protein
MNEWYEQHVSVTANFVGTSETFHAGLSTFTERIGEIEILGLWCHGTLIPNTKENPINWRRVTCGANICQLRRSRKKRDGKNTVPYFDVRLDGQFLRHVILVIKEKKCGRCDKWFESTSFGAFCSSACKTNAWENHPDRETSTAYGTLTSLDLE